MTISVYCLYVVFHYTYHWVAIKISYLLICLCSWMGARCSSVVRAFAHGAMGRRIDPRWGGPIELFLVM